LAAVPAYAEPPAATVTTSQRVTSWIVRGALATGGLVGLLYATAYIEGLVERAGDFLAGSSAAGAGVLGLAVGMLHTFAGPDHLAGLAPLIIGQRRSPLAAFGLGALWGSGHATGQLLIGLGCLAVHAGLVKMQWANVLGQVSGVLVGASLIAIGALGFYEARNYEEAVADGVAGDDAPQKSRFGWTTYATGVLHGLSLDAIIFITPALALPRLAGISHVVGVVGGTLLSMGAYTALLSALCRRSPRLRLISTSASSMAALLGVIVLLASLGVKVSLPGLPA